MTDIEVFLFNGEIYEVPKENIELLKKKIESVYKIEKDVLSWALYILVKKGFVDFFIDEVQANDLFIRAAENTLKLFGKTPEDVEKWSGV
ncbi:MAG: hypothetical protein QXN34_06980 [Archaeoglobaceae archaeon]